MQQLYIVPRCVYHYFVYMQPVTIQLMYNDNKEIKISTENQRCECNSLTQVHGNMKWEM